MTIRLPSFTPLAWTAALALLVAQPARPNVLGDAGKDVSIEVKAFLTRLGNSEAARKLIDHPSNAAAETLRGLDPAARGQAVVQNPELSRAVGVTVSKEDKHAAERWHELAEKLRDKGMDVGLTLECDALLPEAKEWKDCVYRLLQPVQLKGKQGK